MTAAERNRIRRKAGNKITNAFKDVPCKDCGRRYPPVCMDFDHVRGEKRLDVSRMKTCNVETILAEIQKCDVVCANCHRIRTQVRRQGSTPER